MDIKQEAVRQVEYDAAGAYQKEVRTRRIPGNIPMELVGRIRAREMNSMASDPAVMSALQPGYGPKLQKIMLMDKQDRLTAYLELADPEEIKAAIVGETDPDVVRYLAEKYSEALLSK